MTLSTPDPDLPAQTRIDILERQIRIGKVRIVLSCIEIVALFAIAVGLFWVGR